MKRFGQIDHAQAATAAAKISLQNSSADEMLKTEKESAEQRDHLKLVSSRQARRFIRDIKMAAHVAITAFEEGREMQTRFRTKKPWFKFWLSEADKYDDLWRSETGLMTVGIVKPTSPNYRLDGPMLEFVYLPDWAEEEIDAWMASLGYQKSHYSAVGGTYDKEEWNVRPAFIL